MKTKTNNTTSNTENVKTSKLADKLNALLAKAQNVVAAVQEKIKPLMIPAMIITAIYSVIAVAVAICSLTGSTMLDAVTDTAAFDVIFAVLFVLAMISLIITGGIVTALGIFLKAVGYAFGRGGLFSLGSIGGFFISLAIHVAISGVIILLAEMFVLCAPIVPILIYRFGGKDNEMPDVVD